MNDVNKTAHPVTLGMLLVLFVMSALGLFWILFLVGVGIAHVLQSETFKRILSTPLIPRKEDEDESRWD